MKIVFYWFFLLQCFVLSAQHENNNEKSALYTIPVVFHVLHLNGYENISDDQIEDAIRVLNENYSATNASISTIHPDFQGMHADAQIEFKLAKIAPNGQCFNGVTRTFSPLAEMNGYLDQKVHAVINGNDIYQGNWSEEMYLNIFVCWANVGEATSSNFNGNSGMVNNSIFIYDAYVGTIGTSTVQRKDFLTTAVGRWLGLQYTFGPKTFGLDPNNCFTDDGLSDTPNCVWEYGCNLNSAVCGPLAMVENFMALSYCMKFFTNDQVEVMHTTLENALGNRYTIWQPSNLIATGVNNPAQLCNANFTLDNSFICNGTSVQFKDVSTTNAQFWLWDFPGGTPATSTVQNPLVVYDEPGMHSVSLTVSDGVDTFSITKNDVIKVTPIMGVNYTYHEGFENLSDFHSSENFGVFNPDNNHTFEVTNQASHLGNQSALLHNFTDTIISIDAFMSPKIDLTWVQGTQATFSFRYAFNRRANDTIVSFKLLRDIDCSNFWFPLKDLTVDLRASLSTNEDWFPTNSDWQTVHITNMYSQHFTENFRYKFEFIGGGTNNLFIDDINIYEGPVSDDIVLDVSEHNDFPLLNLQLFPNPSNEELTVSFDVINDEKVTLEMVGMLGQRIQTITIHAFNGANSVLLDINSLSKGVYFVKVRIKGSERRMQFIKH